MLIASVKILDLPSSVSLLASSFMTYYLGLAMAWSIGYRYGLIHQPIGGREISNLALGLGLSEGVTDKPTKIRNTNS